MKNLKNTNLIKAICMLFVVAIWNVSCSEEALKSKCSELTSPITNSVNIPDRMENMLEVVRTLDYVNNYDSVESFHADLYGESEEALENLAFVKNEMDTYEQIGYNSYVDKQLDDELINDNIHKEFINFGMDLENLLAMEPSLDEFKAFVTTKKAEISGKELCDSEIKLMQDFYDLVQGAAQYFYKHYTVDGEISMRGCGFFKKLGCFALSLIVAVIGTVIGIIIFTGAVVTNGDKSGTLSQDQSEFLALALGIYLGFNFYKWCCGKDDVEEQVCEAPTGAILQPTTCDGFRYTIYGPSTYGLTDWTNTNLDPGSDQTPTPSINLSVIDPNEDLAIYAEIACLESGSSAVLYTWDDEPEFEVPGNINLSWVTYPPSAAQQGSWHPLKVSTPNSSLFTYEWTVSNNNVINGTGNSVMVKFINSGYANITVKVTNTCTGQVQVISAGTFVYI